MTSLDLTIAPELPGDFDVIESLNARAFGPGRFAKTAYRLRDGVPSAPGLCFVARVGTLLVASIRLSALDIAGVPALLLGPLTVEPAFKSKGIGQVLLRTSLDAAKAQGHQLVILVGDEPYYAKVGFRRVPDGRLSLPGPVNPARLLYSELVEGAFDGVSGAVKPGA
jgi:predicted N-acetyltransferase YhbS